MKVIGWTALLLLLCHVECVAQIINIESKRANELDSGFSGNVDLNLEFTKNTTSIWLGGAQTSIRYKKKHNILLLAGDIRWVSANKESFLNKGYEHLRYVREVASSKWLMLEAFQQVSYDLALQIKMRSLVGAGFRAVLLDKDSINVNMGYSLMFEYEEITDNVTFNRNMRQNLYLVAYVNLSTHLILKSVTYLQPQLLILKDFRVSNESSLSFKIVKTLSFKATLLLRYDSRPPINVPSVDYNFTNGLTLKF